MSKYRLVMMTKFKWLTRQATPFMEKNMSGYTSTDNGVAKEHNK